MEELNEEVVESKKGLTGRSEGKSTILIPGEIESVSKRGVTVAAGTVYDYKQKKFQQDINEEVVEGLQQLTDDINDNVKHTLSDHSSEIEEINESLEENIPYVIVYENQTVNIPCDPYGTYTGSEQEIGTVVKLYRGNIQQEIEYDTSIAIDSPTDKGFTTSVEEDGSAIISIPYTDISNLDDTTDVDFHILSQGKAYYGKVIFNKVKRGKSAFEEWKELHPEIENPTPSRFVAELKNTNSINGPKYAPDVASATENLTIYFIPNSDPTKFDIYLCEDANNINPLAEGIPGDITNYAGIYDVSADHNNTSYATLALAIAAIANTAKKGGMTIKYIDSESGKYVQYRLTKSTFSTDVSDWERVSLDDIRDSIKSILGGEEDVDVEITATASNKYYNCNQTLYPIGNTFNPNPNTSTDTPSKCYKINVEAGERYKIIGRSGESPNYSSLYMLTDLNNVVVDRLNENARSNIVILSIAQGGYLYVNLSFYQSGDGVFRIEKQQVTGLLSEKISDTSDDGKEYVRKKGQWVESGIGQVKKDLNGYNEESYEKIGTVTSNAGINLKNKTLGQDFEGVIAIGNTWTGFGGCIIDVQAGDVLHIKGKGFSNTYQGLYILTGNNNVVKATYYDEVDARENPIPLEVTENGKLYVNFYQYNSSKDGVFKKVTSHVDGIKDRVSALEDAMSGDEESPIEALVREVDGYYEDKEVELSRFYNSNKYYFNFRNTKVNDTFNTEYPSNLSTGTNDTYRIEVHTGDRLVIKGVGEASNYQGLYVLTGAENTVRKTYYNGINARTNSIEVDVEEDGILYVNLNSPIESDGVFKIVNTYVPGLTSRVETLENADKNTIKVCLPNTIYAVVGDTLQVFYRSIIQAVNPYNYNIQVTCAKGKIYPRYFEYIPTSDDIGTTKLTVRVRDDWGNIIGSAECNIVTKAAVKAPTSNLNVAIFGDSLTYPRTWVKEAYRRLTDTGGSPEANGFANISFVGPQYTPNGPSDAKYCAYGGWHWGDYTTAGRLAYRFNISGVNTLALGATYSNNGNTYTIIEVNVTDGTGSIRCTVANSTAPEASGTLIKTSGEGDASIAFTASNQDAGNPLWHNSKIDFANYAEQVASGEDIDVVYTLLTWNGWGGRQTNFDSVLAQVKAFTDALHADFPNAKLKLMGIQLPSLNGGMGSNYTPNDAYSNTYNMVVTAQNVNMAYKEFAESEEYSGFVEYVDVASQFDSENNMQTFNNKNVNTRSTNKEWIGSNGVHPDETGYAQIADVFYRNFICNFCQ